MRVTTIIMLVNILLVLTVFLQAVVIYKTLHQADDIISALQSMEFELVE